VAISVSSGRSEAAQQLAAEHGAGRRGRVDQVDVAEAGVGGVVVDDHGAGGALEGVDQVPRRSREPASKQTNRSASRGTWSGGRAGRAGQEAVVAGDHERLGEADHASRPALARAAVQGQGRAEGVAVGMDVAGDHRHLGLGDRVGWRPASPAPRCSRA
jgi:hypothetical protein